MTGQLFINNQDAFAVFGVVLEDGSSNALRLPAPMKSSISNNAASQHGEQVKVNKNVDKRDLSLTFLFSWKVDYNVKYDLFVKELEKVNIALKVPALGKVYNLLYVNCRSYDSIRYAGKIVVNFTEPNPKSRINLS